MESPSDITIEDFYVKDIEEQNRIVKEYYIPRYNDCIEEMKNSKNNDKTHCFFKVRVQEMDTGYNFMDCLHYIMTRLQKKGFTIKYIPLNTIRISWINEAIEKAKIEKLHKLYLESQKADEKVVIAPPIMWFGSKSRQDEAALKEMQIIAGLKKKKKVKKSQPPAEKRILHIKDANSKEEFIKESRNFLLH